MMQHIYQMRVRYADTDRMGFLYYGHYAKLYEIGRAEFIRQFGISYKSLEDEFNIIMPVLRLETTYKRSALYDDLLDIHTFLKEMPTKMIQFDHEIYNQEGKLLAEGLVKLFFIDTKLNKRISCPPYFSEKITPFFK